jgi:hypothetical protein
MPVEIPGRGDLSPRRRHHRPGRWLAAVVVLALVAGASYAGYRHFNNDNPTSVALSTPPRCTGHSVTPTAPRPPAGSIVINNGTLTTGLAHGVSKALKHRGFHVASVGNTNKLETGIATVKYSPDRAELAYWAAAQFSGAQLEPVRGYRVAEVDIGPRFTALVSRSAAQSQLTRLRAAASPSATASPSPTPTPSPTCRPS